MKESEYSLDLESFNNIDKNHNTIFVAIHEITFDIHLNKTVSKQNIFITV